jgi:hypothetical protein
VHGYETVTLRTSKWSVLPSIQEFHPQTHHEELPDLLLECIFFRVFSAELSSKRSRRSADTSWSCSSSSAADTKNVNDTASKAGL